MVCDIPFLLERFFLAWNATKVDGTSFPSCKGTQRPQISPAWALLVQPDRCVTRNNSVAACWVSYLDPANNSKGLLYQVRIAAATFNAHKRWVKTDSLYPQHKRRPIPISPSFLDFPASFKMRGWLIDRKTSGGPRRMLCFDCLRAQFPI